MFRKEQVSIMIENDYFLKQFLGEIENDPSIKEITHQMYKGKYPSIKLNVGGNIEQVTVMTGCSLEDFMAVLGFDREENSNGTK